MLPRRLLRRPRKHGYRLDLVQPAAHGRLVVLPPHARRVVDKRPLPERVGARRLRDEALRLLLLLLRHGWGRRGGKVLGERVGARGCGLERCRGLLGLLGLLLWWRGLLEGGGGLEGGVGGGRGKGLGGLRGGAGKGVRGLGGGTALGAACARGGAGGGKGRARLLLEHGLAEGVGGLLRGEALEAGGGARLEGGDRVLGYWVQGAGLEAGLGGEAAVAGAGEGGLYLRDWLLLLLLRKHAHGLLLLCLLGIRIRLEARCLRREPVGWELLCGLGLEWRLCPRRHANLDLGLRLWLRLHGHGRLILFNRLEKVNEVGIGPFRSRGRLGRCWCGCLGCSWWLRRPVGARKGFGCVAFRGKLEPLGSSRRRRPALQLLRLEFGQVLPPVDLKVGVLEILLQLAPQVDRSVLQLGDLDPCVVLKLPRDAEVLDDKVCLAGKCAIDVHSSFGIRLGHFEKVPWSVSEAPAVLGMVSYLEC